jgi:protein-tyrosine sulfotransferase
MAEVAPMLQVLGYDPNANPPVYGTPDDIVLRKTEEIHKNETKWKEKAAEFVIPERLDGENNTEAKT